MFNGSDLKRKKRSVDLISKSKMLETFEQFTVRMKKKNVFTFPKKKAEVSNLILCCLASMPFPFYFFIHYKQF